MANHNGVCSICMNSGKLSEDHIPPKSCGNNSRSYYISFTPEYLVIGSQKKQRVTQNGIKFRTICPHCNSELGSKYDKDLTIFRNFILDMVEGKQVRVILSPINVIKGVIGHIIAASGPDECIISKAMRKFYQSDSEEEIKSFVLKYSLLCFYYPYKDSIFILKNYVAIDHTRRDVMPNGVISSLYFYPFAFIICDKQKGFFSKDILELLSGHEISFSDRDWFYENGVLRPKTWPAIVDDNGHMVFLSGVANYSIFKDK